MPSLSAAVIGSWPWGASTRSPRVAVGGAFSSARTRPAALGVVAAGPPERAVVAEPRRVVEPARVFALAAPAFAEPDFVEPAFDLAEPDFAALPAFAEPDFAALGFAVDFAADAFALLVLAPPGAFAGGFDPPSPGFTSAARFALRRPGRARGRFPITPGSSVTPSTISRTVRRRRLRDA
jgi:hypothetical protein